MEIESCSGRKCKMNYRTGSIAVRNDFRICVMWICRSKLQLIYVDLMVGRRVDNFEEDRVSRSEVEVCE